jgi:hypothetical protein
MYQINEHEEFKEKMSENGGKVSNKSIIQGLIYYPRLQLTITNSKYPTKVDEVHITPNSINGVIKKTRNKFIFGRSQKKPLKSNKNINELVVDYECDDDMMSNHQFEISFSPETKSFYIIDNKKGSGVFIKIKSKLIIESDSIFSFCSTHMIVQIFPNKGK